MNRRQNTRPTPRHAPARPIATTFLLLFLMLRPASAAVKYETTSDWGTGFNGRITIINTTARPLNRWTLQFDFPRTITSVWDATLVSHKGSRYVYKSAGYNDSIAPHTTLSFGIGGTPGGKTSGPTRFVLRYAVTPAPIKTATPQPIVTNTPTPSATVAPTATTRPVSTPVAPIGISAKITQTSRWNGGFGADLEIFNNSSQTINNWTLTFRFTPEIGSLWNGIMTHQGDVYTVRPESWNGTIAPGASIKLGFSATGELATDSVSQGTFNGAACAFSIVLGGGDPNTPNPGGNSAIVIGGGVDTPREALQITVAQGVSTFALSLSGDKPGTFSVAANNPQVVDARVVNGALQLNGLKSGRAGLRIQEAGGATRYVGVRVKTQSGALPGWPDHLALGSVSEDTPDHLDFWHGFGSGAKNRYVDARYIYLNGGPTYGWATWTNTPGGRAINYIRESKKLGMLPIFVWYNIPDGGESYTTDLEHIGSATYMKQYFELLQLFLNVVKTESPDEPVGIILEPDFLGYLAQNAGKPASQIAAQTHAAYDAGILNRGVDPDFPDTVQGLVQSINYLISNRTPQAYFGWQMNLWASPAGGWTTPIPGTGLMHLTDNRDFATGRTQIFNEAAAITQYYVDAGVKSYGAKFMSIDKYGLDAATAESSAAQDPAHSTWFWNADQWNNYLAFVRAMHQTSGLPIVLWQLPVGHINTSRAANPYAANGAFPDLKNADRQGEDSSPTFFFGDEFVTSGARFDFFKLNRSQDGGTYDSASNTPGAGTIVWGEHFKAASDAGVAMALFGAGVGGSTTNVGSPPSDSFWWIVKAQKYLDRPTPLSSP